MYSNTIRMIRELAFLFHGHANTSKHKVPSCANNILPNLLQLAPSLPAQETDQIGLQLARGGICQQQQRSRPITAIHRRSITYSHDNCHCGRCWDSLHTLLGLAGRLTMEHQQQWQRLHGTTAYMEAIQRHTRRNGSPESCQIAPSATGQLLVYVVCRAALAQLELADVDILAAPV